MGKEKVGQWAQKRTPDAVENGVQENAAWNCVLHGIVVQTDGLPKAEGPNMGDERFDGGDDNITGDGGWKKPKKKGKVWWDPKKSKRQWWRWHGRRWRMK